MIPLKERQRVEVLIAGQWQLGDAVEHGAIGFRVQLVGEPAGLTVYYYADEGKTWRRVGGGGMSANSHSLSAQVDPTNASEHLTHIRVTAWRKGEEGLDAPLVRLRIDVDGSGYQIMLTPNGASKLASQLSAASDYAESTGECAP